MNSHRSRISNGNFRRFRCLWFFREVPVAAVYGGTSCSLCLASCSGLPTFPYTKPRNLHSLLWAAILWLIWFFWGSVVFRSPLLKDLSSIPYVSEYPAISGVLIILYELLIICLSRRTGVYTWRFETRPRRLFPDHQFLGLFRIPLSMSDLRDVVSSTTATGKQHRLWGRSRLNGSKAVGREEWLYFRACSHVWLRLGVSQSQRWLGFRSWTEWPIALF